MRQNLEQPLIRKALLMALLIPMLALAVWTSTPAPVDAASNNCIYYSNSSYTTVVGKFGYDCCNNRIAWGVKTQYAQCSPACFYCVPPPID